MTGSRAPIAPDRRTPAPEEILEIASGAARAAGTVLMERFRAPVIGLRSKSTPTDLVSEADERAERAVVGLIRERRPDDALVAEEGSRSEGRSGLRWYVDPLDGTINYLYGLPHWCVSVACVDADGAIAGAILDPSRDELFTATRSGGAWLGTQRLAANALTDLAHALVATGFSYQPAERATQARVVARIAGGVRDIRRAGSAALDLAWVAAGRLDAYFEVSRSPWDSAAGELLVREAGGSVTWTEHTEIVASAAGVHAALLALVRAGHETRG